MLPSIRMYQPFPFLAQVINDLDDLIGAIFRILSDATCGPGLLTSSTSPGVPSPREDPDPWTAWTAVLRPRRTDAWTVLGPILGHPPDRVGLSTLYGRASPAPPTFWGEVRMDSQVVVDWSESHRRSRWEHVDGAHICDHGRGAASRLDPPGTVFEHDGAGDGR